MTKQEQLTEWNDLADEFARLVAEYRSVPLRARATMTAARRARDLVYRIKRYVMYGLIEPKRDRADEASDALVSLRWRIEIFRAALDRDPALRSPRGSSVIHAPDIRLPETIDELRELFYREAEAISA